MVRQSKGCVYTMKKTDSPTMKDVAREAGVALGTVSKVINGIPVGESYRQRVEDAIEKLGYHVNSYARGLKTNKTNCVALLMPSLYHPFFAILTDELTKAWSGMTTRQYKNLKGLKKQSLHDNMSTTELTFNQLAEVATRELSQQEQPEGFEASKRIAHAGHIVACSR